MTNCSNIQEFRNFETKFIDTFQSNDFHNSTAGDNEQALNDLKIEEFEKFFYDQKSFNSESKTIRCVIEKDFEVDLKKFDRGDAVSLSSSQVRPVQEETSSLSVAVVDEVRLQNHLKWKKQKEDEFHHKKEIERIAQLKKKEEEMLREKIKKQKEKENKEKIREWQEQKAREKNEKKKEKMVIKILEEELKQVTPTVNKEKLIEEWVKLKNKQKQMEAEKKAEILKREEEGRILRQNLAKLSYREWKERVKGRNITLPKNGYQIFGPKPAPVVKEDWNHDFTSTSPQKQDFNLRSSKSNTTTSLAFRSQPKCFEIFSKDIFDQGDLKSNNSSFYDIKSSKSGLNLWNSNQIFKKIDFEMPLKELQPETIDLQKNFTKSIKNYNNEKKDFSSQRLKKQSKHNKILKINGADFCDDKSEDYSNLFYFNLEGENQNDFSLEFPSKMESKLLMDEFPRDQSLGNKKKVDVFINTCSENIKSEFPITNSNKQQLKMKNFNSEREVKKITEENKVFLEKNKKINSKEKMSVQKADLNGHKEISSKKASVEEKRCSQSNSVSGKICRRSSSYDKAHTKKFTKDSDNSKSCSLSKSVPKISDMHKELRKPLRLAKSKLSYRQKKRGKRQSKLNTPELLNTNDKNKTEPEVKSKRKVNKKNLNLSKSLSFSDSPYSTRKTSKTSEKGKLSLRKSERHLETKSARAEKIKML